MAYFGGTVSHRPWPRLDIRFALLLILSVVGIAAAIWLARESIVSQLSQNGQQFLSEPQQLAAAAPAPAVVPVVAPKTTEVLVAVDTISAGTRLRPSMFRLETKLAENNLGDRALLNLNEIEGAFTRVSLGAGSPLLRESIAPLSTTADITERIPPGYRAVAIPVNIVTGVEGWVQPGARVDVVWTTENRGRMITTTLVENAQVLSAERRLEDQPQAVNSDKEVGPVPNHVTLLVTTRDSQRLQLAKNSGSLSLSLRGDKDVDPGNAATLSTDSIIKNRTQQGPSDVQGKVSFGGQEYVLSGSELLPHSQYQARAKMKGPSDF